MAWLVGEAGCGGMPGSATEAGGVVRRAGAECMAAGSGVTTRVAVYQRS
jgi:hypothetical protein